MPHGDKIMKLLEHLNFAPPGWVHAIMQYVESEHELTALDTFVDTMVARGFNDRDMVVALVYQFLGNRVGVGHHYDKNTAIAKRMLDEWSVPCNSERVCELLNMLH